MIGSYMAGSSKTPAGARVIAYYGEHDHAEAKIDKVKHAGSPFERAAICDE
jgi:hypothetical protein